MASWVWRFSISPTVGFSCGTLTRVFPAASSIKLAILLELYRQDQEARAVPEGKPEAG